MAKKSTVKLRVFKGKMLSYNADGSVQNENQLITLPHNRKEWVNFLDKIKMNNYLKVEVASANYIDKKKNADGFFDDIVEPCTTEEIKAIEAEVEEALALPKAKLTPEQIRIQELEEKLEALLARDSKPAKKEKVEKETEVKPVDEKLEAIKAEYREVIGEEPHHMAKAETLLKKIEEAKQ